MQQHEQSVEESAQSDALLERLKVSRLENEIERHYQNTQILGKDLTNAYHQQNQVKAEESSVSHMAGVEGPLSCSSS